MNTSIKIISSLKLLGAENANMRQENTSCLHPLTSKDFRVQAEVACHQNAKLEVKRSYSSGATPTNIAHSSAVGVYRATEPRSVCELSRAFKRMNLASISIIYAV